MFLTKNAVNGAKNKPSNLWKTIMPRRILCAAGHFNPFLGQCARRGILILFGVNVRGGAF